MRASVSRTILRGETIYADGVITGPPVGRYLRRPQG